ncbi:hypothetical protein FAVG1_03429 [Fusarium avenaceum]|nr:hypothetical protein FAVG1_03429 [Fusarium avenaceum]
MSLRRPKLVRENHRDEQETLMTPVRGRGYRLHNNYVDVSKVLQEPRNLYPSPDFDQSVFSPGSVASPGASEVFSPISAASTPDSVYSTTGFDSPLSSFRGSSRRMRDEESPTRHGECDDISFLTREMARKMKLCEDNSSIKDNLIDGEAVGNKNNIIGEGDEESNDESDDRRHQEWFETSVEEALRVTKVWQEFSKLKPYEDSGELNRKWWDLASGYQNELGEPYSDNMEWLTVWTQKLTRMGKESIKERKEALLDRLKDAEESTKWAERQLRKAEEEEDSIRRGLSELKIGDKY